MKKSAYTLRFQVMIGFKIVPKIIKAKRALHGGTVLMKYSLQFILDAIRYYLAGLGSQKQAAKKFSVAHVQLRR